MITDISNHIIKDNFFNETVYKKILIDISRLKFSNRHESVGNNLKNIYQKIYFNVPLSKDHFAVQETINILNSYKLNVNDGEHNYFLSASHEGASIHNDVARLNCLIYIKGKNLMNSGTGFYHKENDELVLNRHIGFKENRALIFDSKIFHTSLQFNEVTATRYVMANFFNYK